MKAYVFKMNGFPISLDELKNCLQYEQDYCDLFTLGKIECEDCSSDNSNDIISVEEIELEEDKDDK